MLNVYLPGILLTHFLWPHHYENFLFFREKVISRIPDDKINFCDIGPGTGFYTRLILENKKKAQGHIFDISDHSIKFTKNHCKKFNVLDRLVSNKLNVINSSIEKKYDFLINVEVLEHMEDPIVFLKALQKMMKSNSYGFITAAVNAALEDHIYLYRSGNEVKEQIENCGFTVIEQQYDIAYEPKKNEPVPESVAFLVSKKVMKTEKYLNYLSSIEKDLLLGVKLLAEEKNEDDLYNSAFRYAIFSSLGDKKYFRNLANLWKMRGCKTFKKSELKIKLHIISDITTAMMDDYLKLFSFKLWYCC